MPDRNMFKSSLWQKLYPYLGKDLTVSGYTDTDGNIVNLSLECADENAVIFDTDLYDIVGIDLTETDKGKMKVIYDLLNDLLLNAADYESMDYKTEELYAEMKNLQEILQTMEENGDLK